MSLFGPPMFAQYTGELAKTCETCWCEVKELNWDSHVEWHQDLREKETE